MEHSKLPWNRRDSSICSENADGTDLFIGTTSTYGKDGIANADFIVTACNAHGALKALVVAADLYCKEKLLNDPVRSGRAWYDSEERDIFQSLTTLIAKAKELQ